MQETITIGTEIFAVNPTDIILDGTRVVPGAPAVTVDGEVISADASGDLFARSTEILAGHPILLQLPLL